jgi:hypothetical protein
VGKGGRGGTGARATGAIGGVLALLGALLVATTSGARLGVAGSTAGVADPTHLDYALQGHGRFARLRAAYVDRALGLSGPGDQGVQDGGPASPGPASTPARPALALPTPAVVFHPFTNRDFAHAYEIGGLPFASVTDTRSETRQPGEPATCSAVGGSAWYRFVPATSMTLQVDTTGTNYPVALGVFAGSQLADLDPVACATSATGGATAGFLAIAGEPYYFQISGPAGGGELHFRLARHPETILLTTILDGYRGVPDDPRTISGGGATADFRGGVAVLNRSASDASSCDAQGHGSCDQVWYGDLHDFRAFRFDRASVSSRGQPANGASFQAKTSADGRLVVFDSVATNLVDGDTNAIADVFVHDRMTGRTTRESLTPSGQQLVGRRGEAVYQYDGSFNPFLSDDGHYLAYQTDAANLGPGDTCTPHVAGAAVSACFQVVIRDRWRGTTTVVTRAPSGALGNDDSVLLGMTPDGRFLLVGSLATNLIPGPTTACRPPTTCLALLLWDRLTSRFELESVSSRGVPADGQLSRWASVSATGRFVSFATDAGNLLPGGARGTVQTFVHDRVSHTTEIVSVAPDGQVRPDPQAGVSGVSPTPQFVADPDARYSSVSEDGRYVSFNSAAGLIPGAAPGSSQVYVRDRLARRTVLVSVTGADQPGNGPSTFSVLSRDGALIFFGSAAGDLVANDDNSEWDIFYRGWQQP